MGVHIVLLTSQETTLSVVKLSKVLLKSLLVALTWTVLRTFQDVGHMMARPIAITQDRVSPSSRIGGTSAGRNSDYAIPQLTRLKRSCADCGNHNFYHQF